MMLCKQCGQDVPDMANCPGCGAPMKAETPRPTVVIQPKAPRVEKKINPPDLLKISAIAVSILGLLQLPAALIWYLREGAAGLITLCSNPDIYPPGSLLFTGQLLNVIGNGMMVLVTAALGVSLIGVLAHKPRLCMAAPLLVILHALYWAAYYIIFAVAAKGEGITYTINIPYLLLQALFLLCSAAFLAVIFLKKYELAALAGILPAVLQILAYFVTMMRDLIGNLSIVIYFLSDFFAAGLYATLIFLCIGYVLMIRHLKKQEG